jgi:ring-1,2-phenylacetyl-CoA epoxidase subunit PaaC
MERALGQLWKFTGELFVPAEYEVGLISAGIAVEPGAVRELWEEKVGEVFAEARLEIGGSGVAAGAGAKAPEGRAVWMQTGGKEGKHTEHLGYLLAEMQFLQRVYPNCEW